MPEKNVTLYQNAETPINIKDTRLHFYFSKDTRLQKENVTFSGLQKDTFSYFVRLQNQNSRKLIHKIKYIRYLSLLLTTKIHGYIFFR